jgi:DNA-binding transcriptional ArsR family regulator
MSTRHLFTIADLALALGVSRRTVEKQLADGTLARAGLLEANRLSHKRLFDAASVDVVLWRRRTGGLRRLA